MKRILFIMMIASFACNQPTEMPKQGTKDIIHITSVNKLIHPKIELKRVYEMYVYTVETSGGNEVAYFVNAFFPNDSDAGFGFGRKDLYEKVHFDWVNDTVLKFKTFNLHNDFSACYTFTSLGNGNLLLQTDSINGIPRKKIPH